VKEKDHLEDFGVDGGILEWAGLYSCDWGQGHVAKSFKRSDELKCLKFPSSSIVHRALGRVVGWWGGWLVGW
jgi:hypothetical protein